MDIYAEVTTRIISQMEEGIIPWSKPWVACGKAISRSTGKPYSLLNQMLLGRPGEYLTFKQCQEAGGKVKKGEKSSMVVFWKWLTVEDEDTGEKKEVPFLRYFNVFHIDQCEGIMARYPSKEPLPESSAPADEKAEAVLHDYIAASGIKLISRESSEAFYRPSTDTVVLPLIKQFGDTAEYYSTAFHELTHSTGHPSRLNRLTETARFGSAPYSREELCAELGASFILNHLGIETPGSFRNNAAYINHWLGVLKEDKRLLVSAAGQADKAVRLILGEEADSDVLEG